MVLHNLFLKNVQTEFAMIAGSTHFNVPSLLSHILHQFPCGSHINWIYSGPRWDYCTVGWVRDCRIKFQKLRVRKLCYATDRFRCVLKSVRHFCDPRLDRQLWVSHQVISLMRFYEDVVLKTKFDGFQILSPIWHLQGTPRFRWVS